MRKSFLAVGWSALLAGISGCGSPPTAIDKPTWVDVQPILRGQCLQCHGALSAGSVGAYRFDFPSRVNDTSGPCGELAAVLEKDEIVTADFILRGFEPGDGDRPRMPPEPAEPLLDWQIETLENWVDNDGAVGKKPSSNHNPTITVTAKKTGTKVVLSYVADDADGDSILGELKLGSLTHAFDSPGAGRVTFDIAGEPSGTLEVSARLCDGWGITTRDDLTSVKK